MKSSAEVVIIGGGVAGCSIAYNLARSNVDVVVLERNYIACGASGRCGGIIWAHWYTEASSELMARVGNMTLNRFAHLEEELDADIEYNLEQSIALVMPGEEEEYEEEALELERYFDTQLEFLTTEEIRKLAPYIGIDTIQTVGGYLNTGHISNASANPFLTVHALADAAKRLGTTIYTDTEVTDIIVESGRVVGVRTGKGDIHSRIVVDAAGAWSADVARLAGIKIPTKPYSEEAVVTEPLMPLPYMPTVQEVYVRQTKNGQILIGEDPLPKQEPGYNTGTTLDFLARISEWLLRLLPSFGHVNIQRQWAGIEDVTPDDLPILGEVEEMEGLILACGARGAGFCLSQAIGEIVAGIILKEDKNRDIAEAMSLNRFEKRYRDFPGRWYE
jgi:sarcosine oxidase subunit beta